MGELGLTPGSIEAFILGRFCGRDVDDDANADCASFCELQDVACEPTAGVDSDCVAALNPTSPNSEGDTSSM
jgi:hypothetical protein